MRHSTHLMLLGLFAVALPLLGISVRAEDEGAHQGSEHHDMSAEHWKKNLELSDEQADKLKAAMKAHEEEIKPLRDQMKEAIKSLRDQVKAKAGDDDIKATLEKVEKTHQDLEAADRKHKDEVDGILTPTQRAKKLLWEMEKMHREHEGEHAGEEHKDHADSESEK